MFDHIVEDFAPDFCIKIPKADQRPAAAAHFLIYTRGLISWVVAAGGERVILTGNP